MYTPSQIGMLVACWETEVKEDLQGEHGWRWRSTQNTSND